MAIAHKMGFAVGYANQKMSCNRRAGVESRELKYGVTMKYIKSIRSQGSVTVIELRHAIDFRNVSEAQAEYAEATKGRIICNVLFDLREVPHADSSSLAVLIDLVRYMKDSHICGEVGLCNLSAEAQALIGITKVASLFRIYPTSETAIEKLA